MLTYLPMLSGFRVWMLSGFRMLSGFMLGLMLYYWNRLWHPQLHFWGTFFVPLHPAIFLSPMSHHPHPIGPVCFGTFQLRTFGGLNRIPGS